MEDILEEMKKSNQARRQQLHMELTKVQAKLDENSEQEMLIYGAMRELEEKDSE